MHVLPLILFILAAVVFAVVFAQTKNFVALGLSILTTALILLYTVEGGEQITF